MDKKKDNSNVYLGTGIALGSYVALTTATLGIACPVCVVACPVFLAAGIRGKYRKMKNTEAENKDIVK